MNNPNQPQNQDNKIGQQSQQSVPGGQPQQGDQKPVQKPGQQQNQQSDQGKPQQGDNKPGQSGQHETKR